VSSTAAVEVRDAEAARAELQAQLATLTQQQKLAAASASTGSDGRRRAQTVATTPTRAAGGGGGGLAAEAAEAEAEAAHAELAETGRLLAARDEELSELRGKLAARDAELSNAKGELAKEEALLMELQVTGCHCPHLHHRHHRHLPSHTSSIPSPLQRKDALLSELKAAELAASDPLRQADSLRASAAAVEAEGRNQRVALLATESNRALQAKLRRQEETVEQYQKMLTEARAALRREKASSAAESKRLSEQLYEQHEEGIQKLQKARASQAQPTLTRTAHHSPPLPTPGPHQARRGARAQAVGR